MGSGLSGGPLTGQPVTAALPPAPAGQSAVLSSPLGAGASDVVTKAGSTLPLASVNAAAALFAVATGLGGTESDRLTVLKGAQADGFDLTSPGTSGHLTMDNSVGTRLSWSTVMITLNGSVISLGGIRTINPNTGEVSMTGTDSSGTPGAAVINKPSGKSAIAIGAASVVVTNSLVSAATRVMITPQSRDATCKELIAVPGAGSFTVSGSANATAAVVFSWEVTSII